MLLIYMIGDTVSLSSRIFCHPLRLDAIARVIHWQRACRRAGTHKSKGRSEVRGSGKKIRAQKGSGSARIADPHAPHHVGGGSAFPVRPRDYSYLLPLHTIHLAKRAALSAKFKEGNLHIIDAPSLVRASPDKFLRSMHQFGWGSFLLVHLDGELDPNFAVAARVFPTFHFLPESQLNVYDIVHHPRLILTKKALSSIAYRLDGHAVRTANCRFMVGAYGGGYTREQVNIVKTGESPPDNSTQLSNVSIDGARVYLPSATHQPYATPIFWP